MDFPYSLTDIAFITDGILVSEKIDPVRVRELLIDSRRLVHPESTIFIALTSVRNDGHRYIPELYERGVRNFLVSSLPDAPAKMREARFIQVKDPLEALRKLGAHHRSNFHLPVIGITGSNGKTIVKEWLFQLMHKDKKIVRSPKSYNSQIGVPLSVWKITPENELAIFEAGISLPGEMEKLELIIRPTIGVFTNIGTAHDEGFQDRDQKIAEKLKLFRHAGTIVYCRDHQPIHTTILSDPELKNVNKFTWGKESSADLEIREVSVKQGKSLIRGVYQDQPVTISVPFTDDASLENAIHCWSVMLLLGYGEEVISQRMAALVPIAMRLELKEAINNCSLINDSYNSDINSLGIALDFLNQQTQHGKKTLILSDMLQSGRDQEDLYSEIADIIQDKGIKRIIGIGPEIHRQQNKFSIEKAFFLSTDDFLAQFPLSSFREEDILLKGARLFEFERIGRLLQQKSHETILEINLDSMVHNLNYYRSKLAPGTMTMVMVKAFAYGSGSFEIANLLQFHRVDYLAVAYTDEGVELRKAGITLPVMVMNPEEQSMDLLLKYDLEPEIYNFRVLGLLEKAMTENLAESGNPISIHVKIDTGMHRLGFDPAEVDTLIARLKNNADIHVRSVFSHLAASEDPAEDEFTKTQIKLLGSVAGKIQAGLGYQALVHILNSAGISRFADPTQTMVRLGIGLYGIGFGEEEQQQLRNVSTLKTSISQIREVKAGETVGYNRKGVSKTGRIIAIIPIGYADGFNRKLGNGTGKVIIRGKPAVTVGNISMDSCAVDITDIVDPANPEPVREGEEVIIFGDAYPITLMARALDTIPYEILTGISQRVKRVYFYE